MIRIWESFIRVLQLPETGGRETTRGQSHSPRKHCGKTPQAGRTGQKTSQGLLLSYQATSQQDRGREMEKHLLLVLTHTPSSSSASSLLELRFGTAGARWPRKGFEPSWLKFNLSPAVSATAVAWEHKLLLPLPCPSVS